MTKELSQLTSKQDGFIVHGSLPGGSALYKRLHKYRLQLAPLRFGAGIKGKIVDGWIAGVPVITTPIGSFNIIAFIHLTPLINCSRRRDGRAVR